MDGGDLVLLGVGAFLGYYIARHWLVTRKVA